MLGLVITVYMFYLLDAAGDQSVGPGQLTSLRAAVVQNDTLAFLAVRKGLHRHLLHGSTHLQNIIDAFVVVRHVCCVVLN